MLPPDVILVGASVRSLAESVIRDSKVPFCIDYFGDADLRQQLLEIDAEDNLSTINSYSEVVNAVAELDTTIPIVLSGGAETDLRLSRQLRGHRTVAGASPDCIERLRDPDSVFSALRAAGCAVPDWTKCLDEISQTRNQWLIKDIHSSGGQAVSHPTKLQGLQPGQFFQRRIQGVCFSATIHANASQRTNSPKLLGMALQLSGFQSLNCDGFQFCGNVGPLAAPERLKHRVLHAARIICEQFRIQGIFGIDFILKDDKPWVIEVNPRVTASHELHEFHERADRASHVLMHLNASTHSAETKEFASANPSAGVIARLVVYASEPIRISRAIETQLRHYAQPANSHRPPFWVADIPTHGTDVEKGTPLCSVYLKLPNTDPIGFGKMCQHIPAYTSEIQTKLLPEIQGQIALVEKVCKFSE